LNVLLGSGCCRSQFLDLGPCRLERAIELLDLALPGQHPVQLAVGRMKAHRVTGEYVPLARHEQRTLRKLRACRQAACRIADDIHPVQPVREHRLHAGIGTAHVAA
jgi:hypothetical protein